MAQTRAVMHLSGMQGLQRALASMPDQAKVYVGDAIAKTTFAIERRMVFSVPARTGTLRRSIFSESSGLSGRVMIGVEAFYWPFLEYGTRHMAAQPFIRPAAEAESPIFEQRLRDAAQKLEQSFESTAGARAA